MSGPPFEGGCLCGALRYRCDARPFVAYTCHCLACQKLTASAFSTCMQVPAEAIAVTRGEPRIARRTADSGNTLSTRVCSECGSAIFTENSSRPRAWTIFVGTLDDASGIAVDAHIWTRRKLPWVALPEGHRVFSEQGDFRADYASDPSRLDP